MPCLLHTPGGEICRASARGVAANALGLGPRDRRCNSCRADHFRVLPWPNRRGIRLLSESMQVQFLPAAPLPGSVKVARRPVKPTGVGASPTLAANFKARVAQSPERGASNAEDGAGSPSASANVPGCNVSSRRPGSEPGGCCARPPRCESCHPDQLSLSELRLGKPFLEGRQI